MPGRLMKVMYVDSRKIYGLGNVALFLEWTYSGGSEKCGCKKG